MKSRRLNIFYGKDHVIETKPKVKVCPYCKGTTLVTKFNSVFNKCCEAECDMCDNGVVEK